MIRTFRVFALALPMAALALFPGAARADLQLNMDQPINGAAPVGSAPWATATFHTNSLGDVTLTLKNLLSTSEFIDNWVFNVKVGTSFDALPLTVASVGGPAPSVIGQSSAQTFNGGANMKAGLFNLEFGWPVSNASRDRFIGGSTAILTLTGGDITAESFKFLSAADRHGFGTYISATHVMGIPGAAGTTSGSIGASVAPVPETSSIFMLLGVAALLAPAIRAKLN